MLPINTPLQFSNGTKVFEKFAKTYKRHKSGLFILAPSGTGKTHFINNQRVKHWIDGDSFWEATGAHPKGAWWREPIETIFEVDQRSDIMTVQAKKYGFWLMGASNYWLKPDAIVIPDWKTHKRFIKHREETNYDGGATSDQFEQVKSHRKFILKWQQKGVPKFESIEKAVNHLTKK